MPYFLHRLEVSPKVERSSDVPPPLPPRSPVPPQCSSPSASLSGHVSPDDCSHINVFTPSSSPSSTPISPSNPFLPRMQRNPFFEELIAGELQKSPPFEPCSSAGSSPFHYTTLPAQPHTPTAPHEVSATNMASIKRERPRAVARQISLPALSSKVASPNSPNHSAPCSRSESTGEWEDSFDAFASSRLNSPNVCPPQKKLTTCPGSSRKRSYPLANNSNYAQELQTCNEEPPPLPPRRLLRTSVNEIYSDGWLHRGQELAVHKEAYLLSQTGVASLQRGREGECKRNNISPDPHTSSETSESLSLNSQSHTNVTSPGLTPEDKLKKFKYEPLEDETDCWGGMLFEQDLYGRVCRRNYGQCKVNSHRLSLNAEETTGIEITSKSSGPKMLLDSEISVADLLKMSPTTLSHADAKALGISPTPGEDILETNLAETPCTNNNISFSLTLGDLNMNVNNTDFGFIDSDGSSHSEVGDKSGTLQQPLENSQVAVYHLETKPEEIFTLKDTYIPEMNSSFEISSNKLCKVAPVSQDNCRDYRNELNNVAPLGHSRVNSRETTALMSQNQTSVSPAAECREESRNDYDDFNQTQKDFDENCNIQAEMGKPNQPESFSGVVSARFRPKAVSRQSSSDSPNSQSKSGDREFEQFLCLVQNISEISEGPSSYQPSKSILSSSFDFDKQAGLFECSNDNEQTCHRDSNTTSALSLKGKTAACLKENSVTGKPSEISFEDLHAKVAPNSRNPCEAKIGQSLHEPPFSPSILSALSLSADTPVCCPSIHPSSMGPSAGASTTLAVAPYTSSYSTTFTTDQPLVAARHSLLPEETQTASNLPRQESR